MQSNKAYNAGQQAADKVINTLSSLFNKTKTTAVGQFTAGFVAKVMEKR